LSDTREIGRLYFLTTTTMGKYPAGDTGDENKSAGLGGIGERDNRRREKKRGGKRRREVERGEARTNPETLVARLHSTASAIRQLRHGLQQQCFCERC